MYNVLSPTAPGLVSNIQWIPQTAFSVNISWSPPQRPNGDTLGYSVELERYEGGPIVNSTEVDSNVLTVFFINPAFGKLYIP